MFIPKLKLNICDQKLSIANETKLNIYNNFYTAQLKYM